MISIIIPFYNSADYLQRCLTSVKEQTFTDWEVILVDDNSTDDGLLMAISFADMDPRFKVLHQEKNRGQAAARNRGMSEAKGEYITFLDSDDWWDKDFLERMTEASNTCDVVRCGVTRMRDDVIVRKLKPKHKWQFSIACACLFRSDLIRDISFGEGFFYEDIPWTADLLLKHPKVRIIDYYGYNYRINPLSTTSKLHKADAIHCIRTLLKKGLHHPVVLYWVLKQTFGFIFT